MVITKLFLFAMGGLLCLGLTLIISNTIRLSIYSRQDEIELMLLIGATPRFVRIPFLLEGMLQGFMGSILALFFVGGVHLYMKKEFGCLGYSYLSKQLFVLLYLVVET